MNYQSVVKKHAEDCIQQAFQQSLNYVDHLEAFQFNASEWAPGCWCFKKHTQTSGQPYELVSAEVKLCV